MAEMPLDELLTNYADGDEHGWDTEIDWLWSNHAGKLDMLATSIQERGMQRPILLGDDGRVWDGHHRIAAAVALALEAVPTTHDVDRADRMTAAPTPPLPRARNA